MAIRKNKINHQLEQNTAYVWLIVVKNLLYEQTQFNKRKTLFKEIE